MTIHKDSCCLVHNIIVIENESQFTSVGVDKLDTALECGHQVIDGCEEDVGQGSSLEVAPQSFDQIQIGAVRRQPDHFDPAAVTFQPFMDSAGVVVAGVVADQQNLATVVGPQKGREKVDEAESALGIADPGRDSSGGIVHRAINDLLFVLARRRNAWLLTLWRPHAGQEGMLVDFRFVAEDEGVGCVLAERFFFKVFSDTWAASWACSSRLPLRVCLGRWRENCS